MTNISIIVAIASNGAIGKDNNLLWHLKADLKHFKEITTGHPVIMGRKTYESIGKPLPNRRNIVISSQKDLSIDCVEVFNSLDDALQATRDEDEVFIIGGGEIYRQTMSLASRLYLTVVEKEYEADTFFTEKIDPAEWKEVSRDYVIEDELKFSFRNYVRI